MGLSDLLAGTADLSTEGLLQDIQVPSLKVVTSGPTPENPYELLDPSRVGPVGVNLRAPFDAVVIDSPPLLRTGDALKFVPIVDQTLFVIKADSTDVRQATWAKKLLVNVSARIAGVVLNGTREGTGEYYTYDPRYGGEPSARGF
jgi:Mrp family chromosome partitioning ATPase